MSLRVQFLSFEGCPLAHCALTRLELALMRMGIVPSSTIERVDVYAPDTPDELRRWGSPTILVNGRELTGQEPGDAPGGGSAPSFV